MNSVSVFGLGYVGSVSAACLAQDGLEVIGVDVDPGKVDAINRGESPVHEPGLADLIAAQSRTGRLRATTSLAEAVRDTDIALIAVGTPSDDRGAVNATAVVRVVEGIGAALRELDKEFTVVVRSTLLPQLIEELVLPALEAALGEPVGGRVGFCTNPEFLRESSALKDYYSPPFVVVGADDPLAAERVLEIYDRVPGERIVTDLRTAGMVKYVCNAFHALKIAFANEVGLLAHAMGANGQDVMKIVCQDRQLNISPAYLRPGFAFGGSCLPKDLRALNRFAQREAVPVKLLESILASNDAVLDGGLKLIQSRAEHKRKLGLVGLSFKSGTDDLRESPLVRLAQLLIGQGYELSIYDPSVSFSRLVGRNRAYVDQHLPHLAALLVDDVDELLSRSEMLVVGTGVADVAELEAKFAGEIVDLRKDLAVPRAEAALVSG